MRPSGTFRVVRMLMLLGFAVLFFGPLLAMLDFSTRGVDGSRTWDAWANLVKDPELNRAIVSSLLLALFTVLLMLLLLVPTMIWVRLRVPRATRLLEFLCLLPLTIPALVIVVGITNVYQWVTYLLGDSILNLTFVYVVLVLPFAYRAIESSLSSIDAWLNHSSNSISMPASVSRMLARIRSAAHRPASTGSSGPSYWAARSATYSP